jgi:hypothetical protein
MVKHTKFQKQVHNCQLIEDLFNTPALAFQTWPHAYYEYVFGGGRCATKVTLDARITVISLLVVKILTSSKQNIILKVLCRLGVKVNYLIDSSTNCISSKLWI